MATATKKQDMPPTGGFKPLNYSRVPAKTIIGGIILIILLETNASHHLIIA